MLVEFHFAGRGGERRSGEGVLGVPVVPAAPGDAEVGFAPVDLPTYDGTGVRAAVEIVRLHADADGIGALLVFGGEVDLEERHAVFLDADEAVAGSLPGVVGSEAVAAELHPLIGLPLDLPAPEGVGVRPALGDRLAVVSLGDLPIEGDAAGVLEPVVSTQPEDAFEFRGGTRAVEIPVAEDQSGGLGLVRRVSGIAGVAKDGRLAKGHGGAAGRRIREQVAVPEIVVASCKPRDALGIGGGGLDEGVVPSHQSDAPADDGRGIRHGRYLRPEGVSGLLLGEVDIVEEDQSSVGGGAAAGRLGGDLEEVGTARQRAVDHDVAEGAVHRGRGGGFAGGAHLEPELVDQDFASLEKAVASNTDLVLGEVGEAPAGGAGVRVQELHVEAEAGASEILGGGEVDRGVDGAELDRARDGRF